MRALNGPRPGMLSGDGRAQLLAPWQPKIEIQFDQYYVRTGLAWCGRRTRMQMHLDSASTTCPLASSGDYLRRDGEHQPPTRSHAAAGMLVPPDTRSVSSRDVDLSLAAA